MAVGGVVDHEVVRSGGGECVGYDEEYVAGQHLTSHVQDRWVSVATGAEEPVVQARTWADDGAVRDARTSPQLSDHRPRWCAEAAGPGQLQALPYVDCSCHPTVHREHFAAVRTALIQTARVSLVAQRFGEYEYARTARALVRLAPTAVEKCPETTRSVTHGDTGRHAR